jgi:hypothetical protein
MDRDGFALRVMGLYEDFYLDPGSGRTWQGDVTLGYRSTAGATMAGRAEQAAARKLCCHRGGQSIAMRGADVRRLRT